MVYHILYMVYHILFMVLPACASRWDATIIIVISTMIVKDQDQSSGWQDIQQAWYGSHIRVVSCSTGLTSREQRNVA